MHVSSGARGDSRRSRYDLLHAVGERSESPLALPAPKKANGIDDAKLQAAVRSVGVERVLDALVAVEQAP